MSQASNAPRPDRDLPTEAFAFWCRRVEPMIRSQKVHKGHERDLNKWCRLHAACCAAEAAMKIPMPKSLKASFEASYKSVAQNFHGHSVFFGFPSHAVLTE